MPSHHFRTKDELKTYLGELIKEEITDELRENLINIRREVISHNDDEMNQLFTDLLQKIEVDDVKKKNLIEEEIEEIDRLFVELEQKYERLNSFRSMSLHQNPQRGTIQEMDKDLEKYIHELREMRSHKNILKKQIEDLEKKSVSDLELFKSENDKEIDRLIMNLQNSEDELKEMIPEFTQFKITRQKIRSIENDISATEYTDDQTKKMEELDKLAKEFAELKKIIDGKATLYSELKMQEIKDLKEKIKELKKEREKEREQETSCSLQFKKSKSAKKTKKSKSAKKTKKSKSAKKTKKSKSAKKTKKSKSAKKTKKSKSVKKTKKSKSVKKTKK